MVDTAPPTVSGAVIPESDSIALSWIDPEITDFGYYRLLRDTLSTPNQAGVIYLNSNHETTTFRDGNLVTNHTYYYWLEVFDRREHSSRYPLRQRPMVKNKFTALDKVNLFISIYGRMFVAISFSWWSPYLILASVQAIGFIGLLWYYQPGWIHIIQPILRIFLPERAFHFPQYYIVFPGIYSAFESFILGPTLWVILSAAAVIRLGGHYSRKKIPLKDCIARARAAYKPLLGLWLVETVLVIAMLSLPSLLMESVMYGSPNMSAAISFVMQSLALFISAALLYTIPGIVLDKKGLGEAISDSLGLFFGMATAPACAACWARRVPHRAARVPDARGVRGGGPPGPGPAAPAPAQPIAGETENVFYFDDAAGVWRERGKPPPPPPPPLAPPPLGGPPPPADARPTTPRGGVSSRYAPFGGGGLAPPPGVVAFAPPPAARAAPPPAAGFSCRRRLRRQHRCLAGAAVRRRQRRPRLAGAAAARRRWRPPAPALAPPPPPPGAAATDIYTTYAAAAPAAAPGRRRRRRRRRPQPPPPPPPAGGGMSNVRLA